MNKVNAKMYLVIILICLIFLVIAARMVQLQIINHEEYSYKAVELSKKDINKYAVRGEILDSTGVRLAYSAKYYDLWINKPDLPLLELSTEPADWFAYVIPEELDRFKETIKVITETTGVTQEEFLAKIKDNSTSNFLLKKWVTKETVEAIRAQNPRWMSVYESYRRVYPNGTLASNLIGTTNAEGFGRSGLEFSFNDFLAGKNGKYVMDTDLFGNQLALSNTEMFEPQDGQNIELTINSVLQEYLQANLEKSHLEFQTAQMLGILMNIKTGEILAMANTPSYDLNDPLNIGPETTEPGVEPTTPPVGSDEYWTAIHHLWSNPVASYTYEPGSVSKIITTAIGFEEGYFDIDDHWLDANAEIQVDDEVLKCASHPNAHGDQTTAEALINSCNVAYVKMQQTMGKEVLYDYFEALNLTYRSGLGISGESFPIFIPRSRLINVEAASMAFGHGYSVTPLQMISAGATVVNGGNLMQPHLIKRRLSADGEVVYEMKPKVMRRVFSPETSVEVREILREVPIRMGADLFGFDIGGKTGTTLKLARNEETGLLEYTDAVINSFFGFAPVSDPQYAVLILADTPMKDAQYFSAIPAATETLADTLRYSGVGTDASQEQAQVDVPDVIGISFNAADFALNTFEFEYTVVGLDVNQEQVVIDQYPKPGVTVMKGTRIIIKMGPIPDENVQ